MAVFYLVCHHHQAYVTLFVLGDAHVSLARRHIENWHAACRLSGNQWKSSTQLWRFCTRAEAYRTRLLCGKELHAHILKSKHTHGRRCVCIHMFIQIPNVRCTEVFLPFNGERAQRGAKAAEGNNETQWASDVLHRQPSTPKSAEPGTVQPEVCCAEAILAECVTKGIAVFSRHRFQFRGTLISSRVWFYQHNLAQASR